MINDNVPPTPGTRKHFGVSAESQRLLINFEPVMSEHSVAALQLEEVSDKVSDKGRPKGSAKCPNSIAGFQPAMEFGHFGGEPVRRFGPLRRKLCRKLVEPELSLNFRFGLAWLDRGLVLRSSPSAAKPF